jgi:hypothetical protein
MLYFFNIEFSSVVNKCSSNVTCRFVIVELAQPTPRSRTKACLEMLYCFYCLPTLMKTYSFETANLQTVCFSFAKWF